MTSASLNRTAPAAQDALPDGLPPGQRLFAFMAVAIAVTMAVLDTAIVNVALPSMSRDLGSTPAQAVWIVNAYQLAITVALLPLASVGDSVGYKKVYGSGLALFTAASFACAHAPTLPLLACARAVQGLGAAGIMSVNIALVRYIFPKAQLGVGMGYASWWWRYRRRPGRAWRRPSCRWPTGSGCSWSMCRWAEWRCWWRRGHCR